MCFLVPVPNLTQINKLNKTNVVSWFDSYAGLVSKKCKLKIRSQGLEH
jgi:hypothetical protein